MTSPIPIFQYVPERDAFTLTEPYQAAVKQYGLLENNSAAWIGRYFRRDSGAGTRWLEKTTYQGEALYRVKPDFFQDGQDGPCHPDALRGLFWRDVADSLQFTPEFLQQEAEFLGKGIETVGSFSGEEKKKASAPTVPIFNYIPSLDSFLPTEEYRKIGDYLHITEWNPVVWIGRLFAMDNDYGEHWFDNWDERDAIHEQAKTAGYESHFLCIVSPDRFAQKGKEYHSRELRKEFWTQVLRSLNLSLDTIFAEARDNNEKRRISLPARERGGYLKTLERRIREVQREYRSKTRS